MRWLKKADGIRAYHTGDKLINDGIEYEITAIFSDGILQLLPKPLEGAGTSPVESFMTKIEVPQDQVKDWDYVVKAGS